MSDEEEQTLSPSKPKLIIQGNIVVPIANPFQSSESDSHGTHNGNDKTKHNNNDVEWVGPGLKLLKDHTLSVNAKGIIVELAPARHSRFLAEQEGEEDVEILKLQAHELLCPGLIDLHLHAPQYSYTGTATDRPLMGPDGWLETYTFPAERELNDNPDLCRSVFEALVDRTLRLGTTTVVYFATLHEQPCQTLVNVCRQQGQRALIGKVCMDRNAPSNYVQSLEENVQGAEAVIQYIYQTCGKRTEDGLEPLPLILPMVTPRFIPTCSPELLTALGQMAAKHQCHITSHISESLDEVAFSRHLDATVDFPSLPSLDERDETTTNTGRTDAVIFDAHNLLTNQCIMAHGVYLTENDDWDLLKTRGVAVAHCPLSNFFFADGAALPCRCLMERGNKVGLGTDVAGGYHPSLFHSLNMAVVASRSCEHHHRQQQQATTNNATMERTTTHILDYRHAFYLATLGGAQALGLEHRIGSFAEGMEFDALLLSAEPDSTTPVQLFPLDTLADLFQKLVVLGDDRNVKKVWVQGRLVKP